ncbi:hypothetical protein GCM10009668_38870 [Nocardioides dubius]|uniref:Uncharacterized protein n=1 Tax=Nocardioides dubius TaxID=317019 RepID=A0ABN1U200_9ACTN
MLDPLTFGREQLDQLGATIGLGGSEDLHEVGPEVGRGHVYRSLSLCPDHEIVVARPWIPLGPGCGPGVCQ